MRVNMRVRTKWLADRHPSGVMVPATRGRTVGAAARRRDEEAPMSRFAIRYRTGEAPTDADEHGVVVVEAAAFKTSPDGDFVDLYSATKRGVGGKQFTSGHVVYRVNKSLVADVREVPTEA
jgi:hypothetical protein